MNQPPLHSETKEIFAQRVDKLHEIAQQAAMDSVFDECSISYVELMNRFENNETLAGMSFKERILYIPETIIELEDDDIIDILISAYQANLQMFTEVLALYSITEPLEPRV
jgi:hypothetical protein